VFLQTRDYLLFDKIIPPRNDVFLQTRDYLLFDKIFPPRNDDAPY
jgi:hypothetical protein